VKESGEIRKRKNTVRKKTKKHVKRVVGKAERCAQPWVAGAGGGGRRRRNERVSRGRRAHGPAAQKRSSLITVLWKSITVANV